MSGIFDTHTHILPCLDDGSRSSSESIEMLCSLWEMGVRDVAMTPHFYARRDEPNRFLDNRDGTEAHLLKRIGEYISNSGDKARIPRLYIGAEVAFFNAMSNVGAMRKMCISGTNILLVEMPFERWTAAMINELYELKRNQGVIPMIAHVDRYFGFFKDTMLDELIEKGIKIQINADAFTGFFSRKRSLELLMNEKVHFIGSDCHNMGSRAPNISDAIFEIKKRLGDAGGDRLYENSAALAAMAKPIYDPDRSENLK